ncbi:uncharacterized protein LOC117305088 isoform X2 [Asterias rubens]|uniref:uncharacterized protein LOC117305088 isoform X2 n=1 Tax=Asterias rubens TaxID=7604 RepID=UPI0014555AEA|nr:uncharacterized protein LOC117305088 isoform X2 [Asterias rubens]
MDHTVSKMSHSLLFTLICAAVQLSFSSLNTTFLVDRDNSTFEIVLQPPRECPEKYYLHKARQGEFVLNDGRDVAEETGKCIKCTQCLDGIEVIRPCTYYRDVVCGSKCVQSGFRFDEGTRSCQHEKVLDEGYTHEELRKYLAEQELSQQLVSEVGSTSKSTRHIETQTTGVTEHRHQGLLVTVLGKSQTSTPPAQTPDKIGLLFDEIDSTAVEVSDEAITAEEYLPRAAADDHSESLQKLLFMVVLILLVFTVALYSFAAFRKCRPGFLSRILERRRQMPIPLTIRMSGGRVPTAVTVLPRLRTPTPREGNRDEAQPPGDGHDNDIGDTSDSEEESMWRSDSLNCSCYVYSDDETFHEKTSLLGDGSRSSSCYIHSDYDTSDKEETSLLGNGSLKTSWYVRNDDDTSDNGENIMSERGSLNSLLSRVFNDDDIGDNEENVKLEDDNPTLPLRHVYNDDDISDNGENGLLGDDIRGVCNDDDIDDKDENPVSPLSTVCDGDDNDIGDNGENNQSDDQGSSTDDSLRSSYFCHELSCEEDTIIDDIFKIESSRNEDCLKGKNLLSEDVEVQPCSEEETPFKDTVVTEGDPQDDVFVTVSKKNNSVIDSGCEQGENRPSEKVEVQPCSEKETPIDTVTPEVVRYRDVFVSVSKENNSAVNAPGCGKGENWPREEVKVQPFAKPETPLMDIVIQEREPHDDVLVTVHEGNANAVIAADCQKGDERQPCSEKGTLIHTIFTYIHLKHQYVEHLPHNDGFVTVSKENNKTAVDCGCERGHGDISSLCLHKYLSLKDKSTEANGESTSKYDKVVLCVDGTVIIINKRQSCVDRREQLSRKPFQDGKGVEHEFVMSWVENSLHEDYIKSFISKKLNKRPLLLMGRHGILSNLVQTGGDVRQESDRGTATSPHTQQEYRKRSSSKKLNKRRVLILVQTAVYVKDVYYFEGNYRERCSSAAANWMGDIIRPPPVSLFREYTEDGEVCQDCGFEKSKRYSSGLNESSSVSYEHKTEIKVEDTEILSVENVSGIKSPRSSVRMEADEHKTEIKIIEDTKVPSVENVSGIKSPHSSVRMEAGEPKTMIKIKEDTKVPSVENVSGIKSPHSPVRMEAGEPKTEIKITEDKKVPRSVENVSSLKSQHSSVRREVDEHKTEIIKIIEDSKVPSVENVSSIKSPHSPVRMEAGEPKTEIKIIEDTKVPNVENVSGTKSPHSLVRMEADEHKTEIKIIEDSKVPSVENVSGIKSPHSSVRMEADEHKTEIKIIEDTKAPSVENVSGIKSSHSPVSLEAGVDQVGVKRHDCNAERLLVTTECEISDELGTRPCTEARRRSKSYTELTLANETRLRSRSMSSNLNPSARKTTSDEMHGVKQSLSMEDAHYCRDHSKDRIHLLDSEVQEETKRDVEKASISENLATMDRHPTSDVRYQQDEHQRNRFRLLKGRPYSWNDLHRCNSEETKKVTTTIDDTQNHPFVETRRRSRSYTEMTVTNETMRTTPHFDKMSPSVLNRRSHHSAPMRQFEKLSSHVMNRRSLSVLTEPHSVDMSSRVDVVTRSFSAPTMQHFEKVSSPVMMNKRCHSAPTTLHIDMSSPVVNSRPHSVPPMPHFVKMSSTNINIKPLSVSTTPDFENMSQLVMNSKPLSAPTMPYFEKMSQLAMNSMTLSAPKVQHCKQKSSPITNSKNSTSGRMRLTINPLSTAPADFHQVDRNVNHKLDQLD